MSYIFSNDIEKLLDKDDFDNWFKIVDGQHPMLLKQTIAKYICMETFSILNMILNFVPDWDKKIKEKINKIKKIKYFNFKNNLFNMK